MTFSSQSVGAYYDEGPPVPIPNTVVKLIRAEDTWRATAWKNRSVPTLASHFCERLFLIYILLRGRCHAFFLIFFWLYCIMILPNKNSICCHKDCVRFDKNAYSFFTPFLWLLDFCLATVGVCVFCARLCCALFDLRWLYV